MIKAIIPAPLQLKATSAGTVDNAGIETTATSATGNIDMWRHPKYYKELRKLRNTLDQAISTDRSAGTGGALCVDPEAESDQVISANKLDGDMKVRAPGQGLSKKATSPKSQASSNKHKSQATSNKPQATED